MIFHEVAKEYCTELHCCLSTSLKQISDYVQNRFMYHNILPVSLWCCKVIYESFYMYSVTNKAVNIRIRTLCYIYDKNTFYFWKYKLDSLVGREVHSNRQTLS